MLLLIVPSADELQLPVAHNTLDEKRYGSPHTSRRDSLRLHRLAK